MKTLLSRAVTLTAFLFATVVLHAAPNVDTLTVQGYMKRANGTAVTDGSYTIAVGVFQNSTAIWGKQSSVTVSGGLFSIALGGTGSDLSSLPAGTGMNVNYSAITLNPALLDSAANGAVSYRVYGVTAIDGSNPTFDIAVNSVPTAFVAQVAKSVAAGSVTLPQLASSVYTTTSAASKLVQTDGTGKIDASLLPPADGGGLTGTVAIANGGTGATSAATARSALSAAASGANSDITSLAGLTTALSVAQGGTGATSAATARTALSAAASGANSDITSLTGLTTALSVAQGGTGGTTAATARSALSAAASGANSDITALSGLTGAITTSGNITQSGATTFATGTGAVTLNGNVAVAAGRSVALSVLASGVATAATINALAHSNNSIVYMTGNTATALNGITAGVNGQVLKLIHQGTGNVTVAHNSGSASAANRIYTNTGASVASSGAGAWNFIYLTTASGAPQAGWYLTGNAP